MRQNIWAHAYIDVYIYIYIYISEVVYVSEVLYFSCFLSSCLFPAEFASVLFFVGIRGLSIWFSLQYFLFLSLLFRFIYVISLYSFLCLSDVLLFFIFICLLPCFLCILIFLRFAFSLFILFFVFFIVFLLQNQSKRKRSSVV